MTRRRALIQSSTLFLVCAALVGCSPSAQENDEQKDAHYLNGRARVSSLDYTGAIEEFEKALETNPRSASAHLELALLYEEQMKDFAAAIYHYEQHLKLRPTSEYTDRAKERIKSCKMDLVKSEVLGPVNQSMQRDLERLTTENMLLKQRIEELEARLNGRIPVANKVSSAPDNEASAPQRITIPETPVKTTTAVTQQPPPVKTETPAAKPARTYKVKAGDKLTTIARANGVELTKLLQANPGVDPTRLKIGQTLKIP